MEENKKIKVSFKVVIALIIIVVIIGIAFSICILKIAQMKIMVQIKIILQ